MPRVGSLFSGAGGFDLGFEAAGFEVAWQCEVDRDCVSVLERHWPDVPRYGDVRDVDPSRLAPVDVVIGGFPCQDLSVAGKRAGLKGDRSGLFWEVVRIVRGMREATQGRYPAVVVLENVPGLLSAGGGRDFAAVLWGLRQLGAAVAWRILDARFFGVPQRRRRVFIVADFAEPGAGERRAAAVLSLLSRGSGDSEACGEAGEGVAGDVEDGAGVVGEPIAYQCQGNNVGAIGTLRRGNGGLTGGVPFVANSVQASAGHHGHSSPRGDGSDNLIPIMAAGAHGANGGVVSAPGSPMFALDTTGAHAVAFHMTQNPIYGAESRALGAGNEHGCSTIAVAISENQRSEVLETPYAHQLSSAGGKPGQGYQAVRKGMAVRRLTPRETERLQGWPSDHTRWRANGDEISDGPRYRMVGNGVAAPVAAWIAKRLRAALEAS